MSHQVVFSIENRGEGEFGQSFVDLAGRQQEYNFLTNTFGVTFTEELESEYSYDMLMLGTKAQLSAAIRHFWAGADEEIADWISDITEVN